MAWAPAPQWTSPSGTPPSPGGKRDRSGVSPQHLETMRTKCCVTAIEVRGGQNADAVVFFDLPWIIEGNIHHIDTTSVLKAHPKLITYHGATRQVPSPDKPRQYVTEPNPLHKHYPGWAMVTWSVVTVIRSCRWRSGASR